MESSARHRLLILDDDQDLLELYRELLGRLPSRPEIHTVTSGARALALLSSERFSLLLCDLKMPKMDGLQVLGVVRRKFPQLRTAVLTCLPDEQFRARAYAMGVDLFLEKPTSPKEIAFLLDCIESLLDREEEGGFRGIQSKSLVDIIQLECLSQSSSVLKISNGALEGRIWIQQGDVIDAATDEATGVDAFRTILSWKAGSFELLPAEPAHPRAIFTSYQGLLLETAQALDEATAASGATGAPGTDPATSASPLLELSRFHGVEFLLTVPWKDTEETVSWGTENPEELSKWTRTTMEGFRTLGERLQVGTLNRVAGFGPMQHVSIASRGESDLCVGFHRSLPPETMGQTMQKVMKKWAS